MSKNDTMADLRDFVERIESEIEDRREINERIRDIKAEAKGRGFDTKVLMKVIARRARDAKDVEEEEMLLQTYLDALDIV